MSLLYCLFLTSTLDLSRINLKTLPQLSTQDCCFEFPHQKMSISNMRNYFEKPLKNPNTDFQKKLHEVFPLAIIRKHCDEGYFCVQLENNSPVDRKTCYKQVNVVS